MWFQLRPRSALPPYPGPVWVSEGGVRSRFTGAEAPPVVTKKEPAPAGGLPSDADIKSVRVAGGLDSHPEKVYSG